MNLKQILKEELELANKDNDIYEFLKKELDIKSKIVMGEKSEIKVADVPFPKAGIFYIDVPMNGTFEGVKNLARELIYVKLVETKRLKYINDSLINFDGTDFNLQDEIPDLPFQKEVEEMEKELVNKYWHSVNKSNTKDGQQSFFENVNTDPFFDVS